MSRLRLGKVVHNKNRKLLVPARCLPAGCRTFADLHNIREAPHAVNGLSDVIGVSTGTSVIQGHDRHGFLVNSIRMRGSVIVFGSFTLLWHVTKSVNIAPRNLAIVHCMRPKIELLLVGTGEVASNINPSLFGYFQRHGVAVEPMSTVCDHNQCCVPAPTRDKRSNYTEIPCTHTHVMRLTRHTPLPHLTH